MDKELRELRLLIQQNVIRDIQIKILEEREQGDVIPLNIDLILKDLEDNYKK